MFVLFKIRMYLCHRITN